MDTKRTLKFIIGGDGGIGKTTLMDLLSQGSYQEHEITVGVDIYTKRVIACEVTKILQIWDLRMICGSHETFG